LIECADEDTDTGPLDVDSTEGRLALFIASDTVESKGLTVTAGITMVVVVVVVRVVND